MNESLGLGVGIEATCGCYPALCGELRTRGTGTAAMTGDVSNPRPFLVATLTAAAGGLALVSVSAATSNKHVAAAPAAAEEAGALAAVSSTRELLAGIPQRPTVLGRPGAPVTLVEFADLQCPYGGLWARATLPTLVQRYVRTGKLRIDFRGLAFVGPDSKTALRVAHAAGAQNRLWNVV